MHSILATATTLAFVVLATAGLWELGVSRSVLVWLLYALALGLLLRAVGEFKYVGFFKRVLAAGVALIARQNGP